MGINVNGITEVLYNSTKVSAEDSSFTLGGSGKVSWGENGSEWEYEAWLRTQVTNLTVEQLQNAQWEEIFGMPGAIDVTLGMDETRNITIQSLSAFPLMLAHEDIDYSSNLYRSDVMARRVFEDMAIDIHAGDLSIAIEGIAFSGRDPDGVRDLGSSEWRNYYGNWNAWRRSRPFVQGSERCKRRRVCETIILPKEDPGAEPQTKEVCSYEYYDCAAPPSSPIDKGNRTTGLSLASHSLLNRNLGELIVDTGSIDFSMNKNGSKLAFTADSSRFAINGFQLNAKNLVSLVSGAGKSAASSFEESSLNENPRGWGLDLGVQLDSLAVNFENLVYSKRKGASSISASASSLDLSLNDASLGFSGRGI